MSFSPQILQQVQDSVVPSPILVIPIKPIVTDTNAAVEKNTATTKKENQDVKNTPLKNPIEKTVAKTLPPVEIKKDTVATFVYSDTITNVAQN
ncbi:MAG: hypothetical protein ACK4ON_03965, partial [Bacteroidia bacterium]